MYSFNPSAVMKDIDDKPMKFGPIEDAAARKEINELRAKISKAGEDAPVRVPELERQLADLGQAHTPELTLGEVVVTALRATHPGEELSETTKIDHMEWAVKIRRAMVKLESISFDNETWGKIKERINRTFPSPEIAYAIKHAVTEAEGRPVT